MKTKICEGLKELEKTGVAFIVMPCNFAHQYFEDLQKCITIPLINMVEEAVNNLDKSLKKVSLIGTPSTVDSQIYQSKLIEKDFNFIETSELQPLVNEIIKGIKANKDMSKHWKNLLKKLSEKKIEQIILACTDLNVLQNSISKIKLVDATKILAKSTISKYLTLK